MDLKSFKCVEYLRVKMFSLFCCGVSSAIQEPHREYSERSPLLSYTSFPPEPNSEDHDPCYHDWNYDKPTIVPKTDHKVYPDCEEINRKLSKPINKMININTVIDGQVLTKREFRQREKCYRHRVTQINKPLPLKSSQLVTNGYKSDQNFAVKPIANEDNQLITKYSERVSKIIAQGFKFEINDPIVVPFNP